MATLNPKAKLTLVKKPEVAKKPTIVEPIVVPEPPPPPMQWKATFRDPVRCQQYWGTRTVPYNYVLPSSVDYSITRELNDIRTWLFGPPNSFSYCCGICVLQALGMHKRFKIAAQMLVDNATSPEAAEEWVYEQARQFIGNREIGRSVINNQLHKYALILASTTPGKGSVNYTQRDEETCLARLGFKIVDSGYSCVHSRSDPGLINLWSFSPPR